MITQDPAASKAGSIKAVRGTITVVTMELGNAAAKLTSDPERALASLDSAIELLRASRGLFATVTAEPGQEP